MLISIYLFTFLQAQCLYSFESSKKRNKILITKNYLFLVNYNLIIGDNENYKLKEISNILNETISYFFF